MTTNGASSNETGNGQFLGLGVELNMAVTRPVLDWSSVIRHIWTHLHDGHGSELGEPSWSSRLVVYCQVADTQPTRVLEVYDEHTLGLSESARATLGEMANQRLDRGDFETVHEHVYPVHETENFVS